MCNGPGMNHELVTEFKIEPRDFAASDRKRHSKCDDRLYMIDGDSFSSDNIHVKVLHKALPVFAIVPASNERYDGAPRTKEEQAHDVVVRLFEVKNL